jgi:hypothetical protein
MMVLGLNMLGNMNKEATSQESLGLPFWRLLVASGILSIVIGFFNLAAVCISASHQPTVLTALQSYIFRDKSRNITARRVRSHGADRLSEAVDIESYPKEIHSVKSFHTSSVSSRTGTPTMRIATTPRVDMGSPQNFETASPNKESRFEFNFSPARTLRNARASLLPSYHSTNLSPPRGTRTRASSTYSRSTSGESRKWWQAKKNRDSEVPALDISGPLNVNPNFAHLVKPNLAHHPSQRRVDRDDALKDFD